MRSKLALLAFTAAIAACSHTPHDLPDRGVEAVNIPVVHRADIVFEAAAPGGMLSSSESARLNAWFRSLDLRYGDAIFVDGAYADPARAQVAEIASQYGLMVSPGAPVSTGPVAPEAVRVIVSRTVAGVPNCPNWSVPAQPNYNNRTMSNFGCAVNSNLAAMVANPEDLLHGQGAGAVSDALTSERAVGVYRQTLPTGTKGLQDINTKKGK